MLAGAVADLLDELGLERAHVAGNSLGGWVALELAKAGRALSVAGSAPPGFGGARSGRDPAATPAASAAPLLPVLPAVLRSARGRGSCCAARSRTPSGCRRAAAARLVRSYVTAPGFDGANLAMRSAVFSGSSTSACPSLSPGASTTGWCARPRETVPGWRTVALHGCGHIPTWDDPEQVARALLLASA